MNMIKLINTILICIFLILLFSNYEKVKKIIYLNIKRNKLEREYKRLLKERERLKKELGESE